MKKVLFLIVVILLVSSTVAFAAQPREGIRAGLVTGLPFHIGAMGEYNFGPASVNLSLGYLSYFGFADFFNLRIGGDYNFPTPFVQSDWGLDLYLSVGGHFDLFFGGGSVGFALGFPVTWAWYVDDLPLKVFVKAGPEIDVTGGPLTFFGSAGALYQF